MALSFMAEIMGDTAYYASLYNLDHLSFLKNVAIDKNIEIKNLYVPSNSKKDDEYNAKDFSLDNKNCFEVGLKT